MAGKLTLQVADEMASGAIRACLRNRFKPISLAVLDASGHIVVQKRMDGCAPIGIPEFALAKAWTCISMKMSSRAFRQKYSSAEATPGRPIWTDALDGEHLSRQNGTLPRRGAAANA